jgi:hypothetical protein
MARRLRLAVQFAAFTALGVAAQSVEAACTFGSSYGAEPSLQQSFNSLLGAGSVNAVADCIDNGADAAWTTASVNAGATIVLELAGNAGSNVFGIYDLNDSSRRVDVFQGIDGAGDSALIQITGSAGNYTLSVTEDQVTRTLLLAQSSFGFYLLGANGPLFSHATDNPGDADYMYAYQGNGDVFIGGPFSVMQTVFRPSDYLLAWEDLRHGDNDYQDFVVLTRSVAPVTPVPLPSAAWLIISGLVGLVGVARPKSA